MTAVNGVAGRISETDGAPQDAVDGLPGRGGDGPAPYSRISQVTVHLPETVETVEEIEERVRANSPGIRVPSGLLRRMYGMVERRVAPEGERPSDLAAHAVRKLMAEAGTAPDDIDLLIYSAVGIDTIEPANAHIVAAKTGLTCPVFDVTNACNSVLNAVEVADALIRGGGYRRVLIASGEMCTRVTRWSFADTEEFRTGAASLTCGDAGAAVLVEASDTPGITAGTALANSQGWTAATVFNPYQVLDEPAHLSIDSGRLLASFDGLPEGIMQWMKERGDSLDDVDLICVHQPSVAFVGAFCDRVGISADRILPTFPHTGNIASATLPLQLVRAQEQGLLRPGSRVALFGIASGASMGVILLDW
ncbi:3-oxoacyl-ACP synthase III family protein [Streptomyces sp. BBFR2]|uniref:3-oxoacyl-ACP synthase III family protein n=1 Tax=Streptomyces sp. BBFR2 TaxID=3372854 RepID=UPI0037D9A4E9